MKTVLLGMIISFASIGHATHWRKVECQFGDYPSWGETLEMSSEVSDTDQMRIHEAVIVDSNLDRRSGNLLERYNGPLGALVGLKFLRFNFALPDQGNFDIGKYYEFVLPRNWAGFNGSFAATFRPGEYTPAQDNWGEIVNGTCTAE